MKNKIQFVLEQSTRQRTAEQQGIAIKLKNMQKTKNSRVAENGDKTENFYTAEEFINRAANKAQYRDQQQ